MSWEDEKCTPLGHSTHRRCCEGHHLGLGGQEASGGQSRPWKVSHSCLRSREEEASGDSGLGQGHRQKVHGDPAESPADTGEPPGLGADGRANATSDICAVSLTLGWRGQEESEFCPVNPMASGSTAVPFPCEGWGAEAVSSLLSHGSPSPCISNMSLRGPQHYPPSLRF